MILFFHLHAELRQCSELKGARQSLFVYTIDALSRIAASCLADLYQAGL